MKCPACGSREVGVLSTTQYYCWRCCVEFTVGETGVEMFEVDEDGTLVSLGRAGLEVVAAGKTRPDGMLPGR